MRSALLVLLTSCGTDMVRAKVCELQGMHPIHAVVDHTRCTSLTPGFRQICPDDAFRVVGCSGPNGGWLILNPAPLWGN